MLLVPVLSTARSVPVLAAFDPESVIVCNAPVKAVEEEAILNAFPEVRPFPLILRMVPVVAESAVI